jgi:hypothetical protein
MSEFMKKSNQEELLSQLSANLSKSFDLFEELLAVPAESVPAAIRNKAVFRRVYVCFLSLFTILGTKSELSDEYIEKSNEELADYFIAKQVLPADDRDSFVLLADVFETIRRPDKGWEPDEEMIMKDFDIFYKFIQRMVVYHASQITSHKQLEAAL